MLWRQTICHNRTLLHRICSVVIVVRLPIVKKLAGFGSIETVRFDIVTVRVPLETARVLVETVRVPLETAVHSGVFYRICSAVIVCRAAQIATVELSWTVRVPCDCQSSNCDCQDSHCDCQGSHCDCKGSYRDCQGSRTLIKQP
jgi:hypothetical protein